MNGEVIQFDSQLKKNVQRNVFSFKGQQTV